VQGLIMIYEIEIQNGPLLPESLSRFMAQFPYVMHFEKKAKSGGSKRREIEE